jgi:hypothetical protein
MPSNVELYDVRDLDHWVDQLKTGAVDTDDEILSRLEEGELMPEVREKRENKYKGWQIWKDQKPPFKWRARRRETKETIDCTKFESYTLAFDMEVHRINEMDKNKEAKPGTLGMLTKRYCASPRFQKRAARTRAEYQGVFDWLQPIEDTALEKFTRGFVAKIRDKAEAAHRFRFANKVRSVLSLLFSWGMEYE